MMPGMGVDPQKVAQMQEISQHINGKITVDYKERQMIVEMSSVKPEAANIIPELLNQLAGILAQQLNAFFAIKGEIIERGKPDDGQTAVDPTRP